MNVLSLFDGMSCGQIALERAGISVTNYYAAEIDKYAKFVTHMNYPKTIELGNVENWREWDIEWGNIDLLIGGSPCQGFSFAGGGRAFADPRSRLFFVYVDILNHIKSVNPGVKFMLENVKMKREYLDIISTFLDVEPVLINSALVSAQNRQRYYWANWEFGEPIDKGVILSTIIQSGMVDKIKSYALDASYYKGGNLNQYFNKSRRQVVFEFSRKSGIGQALELVIPILASNWRGLNRNQKQNAVLNCDDLRYRKLSPVECERLQTVPDNYTAWVSNTQRYKMLGNGWTVDVVSHIFKAGIDQTSKM